MKNRKKERKVMSEQRKYPCPQCATGELYDDGGMFMAHIVCSNKKCNYDDYPDTCGVISGDITD